MDRHICTNCCMSSITNMSFFLQICVLHLFLPLIFGKILCSSVAFKSHPFHSISSRVMHPLISIRLVSVFSCIVVKARSSSCFSSKPSVCKPAAAVQLSHLMGQEQKIMPCSLLCGVTHLQMAPVTPSWWWLGGVLVCLVLLVCVWFWGFLFVWLVFLEIKIFELFTHMAGLVAFGWWIQQLLEDWNG